MRSGQTVGEEEEKDEEGASEGGIGEGGEADTGAPSVLYTLLELRRMYSRSIIGIGTEPVPLVRCLLTTRYVRCIGARIVRGRVVTTRKGRGEGVKDGRPCREPNAWYGWLTVLLARCVATTAVMDLAHYWPKHWSSVLPSYTQGSPRTTRSIPNHFPFLA